MLKLLCVLERQFKTIKISKPWLLKPNFLVGSLNPWGNKNSAGEAGATGAITLNRIPDK